MPVRSHWTSSADRKTRASSHGSRILLTADWALSSEDSAFALRLASRTGLSSERSLPSWEQVHVPVSPADAAAPRLALDEPEALLGQDQQIDLVDGPVVGLELEIGPRPVRIVVGQTRSDEVQATPFPLVLRRRDDVPAWRFHFTSAFPIRATPVQIGLDSLNLPGSITLSYKRREEFGTGATHSSFS